MTDDLFETQSQENLDALATLPTSMLSRRRLLLGSGVGALGLIASACGGDDDDEDEESSAEGDGEGGGPGDLDAAKVAASLEVLAVNTYKAALDAAGAGKLGAVPPAVATFATTVMGHHQTHLDMWNAVLTGAGETAVTEPPASLAATVNEKFATVTDVNGVAGLALELEQIAAATYLTVIPALKDKAAIMLASQIHPIDMQHVAVLLFVAGMYPVPDTFAQKDKAFTA